MVGPHMTPSSISRPEPRSQSVAGTPPTHSTTQSATTTSPVDRCIVMPWAESVCQWVTVASVTSRTPLASCSAVTVSLTSKPGTCSSIAGLPDDDRGVAAELAGGRGDLAGQEPAADQRDAALAGREQLLHGHGVGDGAQHVDAGVVARGARQVRRLHAGRDDQPVVVDLLAAREVDDVLLRVEPAHPRLGPPEGAEVGMRRQQHVAGADGAGEHLLAQHGAVVGPVRLVTDDHELAGEVQFTHAFGGPEARAPGADDDDALAFVRHQLVSSRSMCYFPSASTMASVGQVRTAARAWSSSSGSTARR